MRLLLLLLISFSLHAEIVSLAWDPSPTPGIEGYSLYEGQSSGLYTKVTKLGNVLSVAKQTTPGTIFLALKAYKGSEESKEFSNELAVTTPVGLCQPAADFNIDKIEAKAPATFTVTPVVTCVPRVWRWDFPGSNVPRIITYRPTILPQTVTYNKPGVYKIWFNVYWIDTNKLITKLVTVK